jgi:hypothetical protein
MEIYTIRQAKTHLFKLIAHTTESHDPIYIVGKKIIEPWLKPYILVQYLA